jgi:hypothetical protein
MPLTTIVSKRVGQVILLLLALAFANIAVIAGGAVRRAGVFHATLIRCRLMTPKPGSGADWAVLTVFGLLDDGCATPLRSVSSEQGKGAVTQLTLAGPVAANGYYLAVAGPGAAGPLRWVVETSSSNGSTWDVVGASTRRINLDGTADLFPGMPHWPGEGGQVFRETAAVGGPGGPAVEVGVDSRPPLRWSLPILGIYTTMAGGFVACFAAAVLRREWLVKWFLVWVFAATVSLNVVKAALSHAARDPREAAANWLWVPGNVVFLVSLLRFELHFVRVVLFVCGCVGAASEIGRELLYDPDPRRILVRFALGPYGACLLFAVAMRVLRARAKRAARRLVRADQACYDAIWATVSSNPAERAALANLDLEVCAAASALPDLPLCQLSGNFGARSQRPSRAGGSAISRGKRGMIDQQSSRSRWGRSLAFLGSAVTLPAGSAATRRLDSLDQLYAQAELLHPILLDKVRTWAALSRGHFPVHSATASGDGGGEGVLQRFVVLSPPDGDGGAEGGASVESLRIKWCKIKTVERAVEKVVRSYGQVPPQSPSATPFTPFSRSRTQ